MMQMKTTPVWMVVAAAVVVTGALAWGTSGAGDDASTRRAAELEAQVEHLEARLQRMESAPRPEPIVVHKVVNEAAPGAGAAVSATSTSVPTPAPKTARTHVEHLGQRIEIPQSKEARIELSVRLQREAYDHYFHERQNAAEDEVHEQQMEALLASAGVQPTALECRAGACRAAMSFASQEQGFGVAVAVRNMLKDLKYQRYQMIPQGPEAPLTVELYVEQTGSRPVLPPNQSGQTQVKETR